MDKTKVERWITQLHQHAWWILDTLMVTSVPKLDSLMKVSPSQVWELSLFPAWKNHSAKGGCEPYFPVLKPHREVPYPNYMKMSLVSVSEGVALTSCVAEPGHTEMLRYPWEFVLSFLFCVSAAWVRWKNTSHLGFRLPTPSPCQQPGCTTPLCQSPAASVGAGYQHIGPKHVGSRCVSIMVWSLEFIPFSPLARQL